MIVAVIDLGKTNSKVALVDTSVAEEIKVVTQATSVNTTTLYPSIDHQSIEKFVFATLNALSKDYAIDAITVTTHGATAALMDDEGSLALPVLDYEYSTVDESRAEYDRVRPSFSETGSPALPGGLNIGAQLYWQQMHFPQQFSKVTTVLMWPQYWVYLLTGKRHNDVTSLGCHTDLYEPRQQRYSSLVGTMNWQSLMPPTRHSGQVCGNIAPSIAKRCGLSQSTRVYTGIHDSNASLVPHLLQQNRPFTVVSTGTWFITMAIGEKSVTLDEARDTLLNVNAYGDAVPSARFMGGREHELMKGNSTITEATLVRLLSLETPPLLLPSVVQNTGPYPNVEKLWINPTEAPELRDCAVTLYLALMTCESIKLIGGEAPVYIEGPLAHDLFFAQMLGAVSNGDVFISKTQTGTSVGAAMLISTPDKRPGYRKIEVNTSLKKQMKEYAEKWQCHLCSHAM